MGGIFLPDFKTDYIVGVVRTVILAEAQTHRLMEQNKEPRSRPMQCAQLIFEQRCKSNSIKETIQQMVLNQLDNYRQKKVSHII